MQGNNLPLAIVLIGVSGTGKTTIGQRLAPKLDAVFLEGDDFHPIANIAKMHAGTPLTDADRWPWLAALGHAIAQHSEKGQPVVVACSALKRAYRDALISAARRDLTFVHLTIAADILDARMKMRQGHFMPASLLQSQLATLELLTPDEQGTEVAETGPPEQTVDSILQWLRLRP